MLLESVDSIIADNVVYRRIKTVVWIRGGAKAWAKGLDRQLFMILEVPVLADCRPFRAIRTDEKQDELGRRSL